MYDVIVGRRRPGGSSAPSPPYRLINRCRGAVMRTCSIPGCENKVWSKNLCNKHYLRKWKYGDPFYTKFEMHGMENTSEYMAWASMKHRCYNKNNKAYKYYGGRGIIVCNRWRDSFIAFYTDMGLKPFPKAQIDRIDNNGDYELGNCRWTTALENMRNRSFNKLSMKTAEEIRKLYKVSKLFQTEIAAMYGVDNSLISQVVNNKIWI